jgi:hypothetical protein
VPAVTGSRWVLSGRRALTGRTAGTRRSIMPAT